MDSLQKQSSPAHGPGPAAIVAETLSTDATQRNVYIVSLNVAPFLPYIYGLLRVHAEEDPLVAQSYAFQEPFFFKMAPERIVAKLQAPAILGLSCYVWNLRKHMKVARLCKERFPNTLIVAGGPQIPERVGDFLERHPYVDIVVHGEGEISFQRLLREGLQAHPDWSKVPGISFRQGGRTISTPHEKLPRNIVMRSPYLEGYMDRAIAVCRALKLDFIAPWETNRGCPYSCTFCDWGSNTMSKIRTFELDRLMKEVEFFGRAQVPGVHINDANFGILPRDSEIAQKLVSTRNEAGFPRFVRLNFAKNSNERVFEISRAWTESGMLSSTTLSMQATTMEVLSAIKRENIGTERYKDLQKRYMDASIQTYTEIILGLPQETKESFKRGLDSIFEMGNHDDVRIYEFVILPNAPVSEPESVEQFGLKTVEKYVEPPMPGTPPDEVEMVPTVIETNTMSRDEWIDCSVYSRLIQLMHNGCYTRYVAIHLHRRYGLPYHVFYGKMQEYFSSRPETVLGNVLAAFEVMYQKYLQGPEITTIDMSASPPEALPMLQARGGLVMPVHWAWICMNARFEAFFEELTQFLGTLGLELGSELPEILRFQRDIMLRSDYDPAPGKTAAYRLDVASYFSGGGALEERPIRIQFRDQAMGLGGEFPLEKGNLDKFLDAALGARWSDVSCRYQHQLGRAEVHYETQT
jgi:putative methyltransferase